MSAYVPPASYRHLRACMVCSIVQQHTRFLNQGCPNCEEFLELAGSNDAVLECTSQVYEGLITLTDPSQSWVAKWQRLEGYVPGMYAVKVSGVLPEDILGAVERAGVRYIPRDGSALMEES